MFDKYQCLVISQALQEIEWSVSPVYTSIVIIVGYCWSPDLQTLEVLPQALELQLDLKPGDLMGSHWLVDYPAWLCQA